MLEFQFTRMAAMLFEVGQSIIVLSFFEEVQLQTLSSQKKYGDRVLLEFGPSRKQHLAFRSRIISWQPEMRTLFISCVTLLKYRLRLPGFELPESFRLPQHEFEDSLARTLDGMADRLQGEARQETEDLAVSLADLEEAVKTCRGAVTANTQPSCYCPAESRAWHLLWATRFESFALALPCLASEPSKLGKMFQHRAHISVVK